MENMTDEQESVTDEVERMTGEWKRFGNDVVLMVVLSTYFEVTEKNQKHFGTDDGAGRLCWHDGSATGHSCSRTLLQVVSE